MTRVGAFCRSSAHARWVQCGPVFRFSFLEGRAAFEISPSTHPTAKRCSKCMSVFCLFKQEVRKMPSVGRYLGGAAHYNVHVCERCVRAVMGGGWRRRHEGRQRRLRLIGAAQRTTDRDRPLQRFSWPSLGSQGRRGRGKCSSVEAT